MKKYHFFLIVILLTGVFSISLSGCSKDKNALPALPEEQATSSDVSVQRIANWGSITGKILPLRSEVKIKVYNRDFETTDFYYNKDGSFQFTRIPPGIYSVLIIDPVTSREYLIADIKVRARTVINIGMIKLI